MRASADAVARRARHAGAVLFVVNGLTVASVVPWLPEIKRDLALTNTAFGFGWAAFPLGGLVLGIAAGPLAARFGAGPTATRAAVLGAVAMPLVALAPTWGLFAAALCAMGATDAITDAAMNAHALRVQWRYRRSIINSFHALWSVGAVAGGLLGAAAVGLGVARTVHLSVVAAVLVVAVALTARWQLTGTDHDTPAVGGDRAGDASPPAPRGRADDAIVERRGSRPTGPPAVASVDAGSGSVGDRHGVRQALRTAPWLLLGIALLPTMAGAVEDTAASWSAVHLRETLGARPFVAGLGFVAAQVMMVAGRVTGDRFVDRHGPVRVARVGALLAGGGMLVVAAAPAPSAAIGGFALAGLGAATLFPLGMAAAGDVPGVRSADGVAVVSWFARVGFLCVPPLIGVVADAVGLRWGMALVVACALVAAAVSGLLAARDRV